MATKKQPKAQVPETDKTGAVPDGPLFQPGGYDAENGILEYESMSVWWWDNGIWGKAGYALANDGGKPSSGNETIRKLVKFIGAELFNLMHRPDVRFSRPFNADWLFALNKMLALGIKRMSDISVGWTDTREGDARHATNTPQSFTLYPVPHFGGRIRQEDALQWCGQILVMLSEMMQHSDNDYDDNVTDLFTSMVQEDLLRIQKDLSMKYLNTTRAEVDAPAWAGPASDAFSAGNYQPDSLFTEREMIEERMPDQWWPTTNDLTPIAGVAAPMAKVFCKPWPEAGYFGDGAAIEAAWPAGGTGIIARPGSRR